MRSVVPGFYQPLENSRSARSEAKTVHALLPADLGCARGIGRVREPVEADKRAKSGRGFREDSRRPRAVLIARHPRRRRRIKARDENPAWSFIEV